MRSLLPLVTASLCLAASAHAAPLAAPAHPTPPSFLWRFHPPVGGMYHEQMRVDLATTALLDARPESSQIPAGFTGVIDNVTVRIDALQSMNLEYDLQIVGYNRKGNAVVRCTYTAVGLRVSRHLNGGPDAEAPGQVSINRALQFVPGTVLQAEVSPLGAVSHVEGKGDLERKVHLGARYLDPSLGVDEAMLLGVATADGVESLFSTDSKIPVRPTAVGHAISNVSTEAGSEGSFGSRTTLTLQRIEQGLAVFDLHSLGYNLKQSRGFGDFRMKHTHATNEGRAEVDVATGLVRYARIEAVTRADVQVHESGRMHLNGEGGMVAHQRVLMAITPITAPDVENSDQVEISP